ncbi:hypothetical protein ONZ45_g14646 [Pleurotus djamor]|nr:hypothetical protein ONZ45_g14646 [Pleurotus djamor]
MSSNEEGEGSGLHHPLKKRSKVQRACNMCDGSEMKDGMACSNCVTAGQECVYAVTSTKRGPYHGKAYVHKIETRLEKLERLFRHLHPEMDLDDLDGLLQQQELNAQSERSSAPLSRMSPSPGSVKEPADYSEFIEGVIRAAAEISISSIPDEDYSINPRLIEELAGIPKGDFHNESTRFFGKSSEPAFLQAAIDLKIGVTAQQNNNCVDARFLIRRREVFWEVPKWEALPSIDLPPPTYHFPGPDLMQSLIHLYFVHWNLYLPLLHRPTFEKAVRDGLHLRDVAFGGVVMLVCANGAKFSDDPRVLLDGTTSPLSRGWRWFLQVQFVKKSLAVAPSLYDIQFYCLAIHFLKGSSYTHASWLLVGIALRLALDRGIHRSKRTERVSKVDHELWKRAFWILISMDRMISTILGRPSAIGDEDFDLDYPLEVDDEYWDHPDPDQSWKQPPNKPSLITAFSYHLRLTHILGLASRALYSSNKTKTFLGILGYEQTIVAAFDSNLNKWIDSVPEHRASLSYAILST